MKNKKMFFLLKALVLSIVFTTLLLIPKVSVFSVPNIQQTQAGNPYFVDHTNTLSNSNLQDKVINVNKKFETTKESPQISIVTINSLDGENINDYATKLFESYKLGNAEYDNGILILYSKEDKGLKIEVGYGLEGALPDGLCGSILDESIKQYFSNNEIEKGLDYIFDQVSSRVATEYNFDKDILDTSNISLVESNKSNRNRSYAFVIFIIILIALDLIVTKGRFTHILIHLLISRSGNSNNSSSGGGGRSGGGGASRGF